MSDGGALGAQPELAVSVRQAEDGIAPRSS